MVGKKYRLGLRNGWVVRLGMALCGFGGVGWAGWRKRSFGGGIEAEEVGGRDGKVLPNGAIVGYRGSDASNSISSTTFIRLDCTL